MQLPNPQAVYWDDWILFVAQILTLVVLVVYVWQTWQMASATRAAAESSARAVREAVDAMRDAIAHAISALPEQLRQSLTRDQGTEMAQHARLRIDTRIQIYF